MSGVIRRAAEHALFSHVILHHLLYTVHEWDGIPAEKLAKLMYSDIHTTEIL